MCVHAYRSVSELVKKYFSNVIISKRELHLKVSEPLCLSLSLSLSLFLSFLSFLSYFILYLLSIIITHSKNFIKNLNNFFQNLIECRIFPRFIKF